MPDLTTVKRAISVVICSHDPRLDYLRKTLSALRDQTLPISEWELLIIDNASSHSISSQLDLSWHPQGRCIVETRLGLAHARVRGILETQAPLIVFVDDDNLLAPNYLAETLSIAGGYAFLGAWGGQIRGVYEKTPPDFCLRYAHMLAIREVPAERWGNSLDDMQSVPCGAGLSVRRPVALAWVKEVSSDSASQQLGRSGCHLGACEDSHLALLSVKLSLGTGVFPQLTLDHLISPERTTLEYFVRLAAGHTYSYNILRSLLGLAIPDMRLSMSDRIFQRYKKRHVSPSQHAIERAMGKAYNDSLRDLRLHGYAR